MHVIVSMVISSELGVMKFRQFNNSAHVKMVWKTKRIVKAGIEDIRKDVKAGVEDIKKIVKVGFIIMFILNIILYLHNYY
jgi:hypothetical protein